MQFVSLRAQAYVTVAAHSFIQLEEPPTSEEEETWSNSHEHDLSSSSFPGNFAETCFLPHSSKLEMCSVSSYIFISL